MVPLRSLGAGDIGAVQRVDHNATAQHFMIHPVVFIAQSQIPRQVRTHLVRIHDVAEIFGHALPGDGNVAGI